MKILIKNLRFFCIIGILKQERKQKQEIRLDISIKADGFVDYAKVAKSVEKLYKKEKFLLVEDALEKTVSKLKLKFPHIKQIKIKILKTQILENCHVGAKINKKY